MEVGFASDVRFLPSKPEPMEKIYRQTIEVAVLAEELGFAHFWASEHHFAEDGWSPSPLVVLAGIATRTSKIRLGSYVTLLAMHNPLRYAEDAVTVDILSNGRLDLGFGGSGSDYEYKTFGIDPKESYSRAYEAAEVLQKCFSETEFSHKGKYFQFTGVRLMSRPVQKNGPPIFWAAMGPKSLLRSAERNYGLVSARMRRGGKHIWRSKRNSAAVGRRIFMSFPVRFLLIWPKIAKKAGMKRKQDSTGPLIFTGGVVRLCLSLL